MDLITHTTPPAYAIPAFEPGATSYTARPFMRSDVAVNRRGTNPRQHGCAQAGQPTLREVHRMLICSVGRLSDTELEEDKSALGRLSLRLSAAETVPSNLD